VLAAVAMLAGVVAAGIGVLALADALSATGLPDPGPVTTLGLPFTRAVGEIAAVTAVGGTMFAAFLTPPQGNGVLDVGGYRALRLAAAASGIAAVCAVLMVPLTISDVSGEPVREHLNPVELWEVASLVDAASAWRWTALIAAVVAVSARLVLRWSATPVLFAASLLTLVPLGLTGHSASGGSHDVATDSLLIHLFAGALWAGGLLALLAHALRGGAHCDVAARRFSAIALWCFVAMAVSGTVNAGVRIRPADLFSTAYGWLIAAKVAALVVLGLIGWRHRRGAVAALQSDPGARGALIRLAMVEALVFAVTFGVAVGLGRTPPPPARFSPTAAEVALGYDLPGPPTLARIMTDWRFDLVFGSAAIIVATMYLAAVVRLRRRGDQWPIHRTVAWLLGCTVLLVTTSSGLGGYLPAMFSADVVGRMLLSMPVAILLVLGAPATLARSALPAAADGGPPGPREWLLASLTGRAARLLTHPVVATVVFVAGFCYLGGVFDVTAGSHGAQLAMTAVLLLGGYLFFWVVIGIDPVPREVSLAGRVAMLATAIALVALSGALLMERDGILAERFYRSLQLPWRSELLADQHSELLADQHRGAALLMTVGEVPLVVVLLALLIRRAKRAAIPPQAIPPQVTFHPQP
jgi:cytochrome c oxidase assembly factor CtaG/putative copper export protein